MSNESEYRDLGFENPGYDTRECYRTRTVYLLYLTPEEISFGRRIVVATVLGGVIGWERRSADRPAGIRTMSLVSLGACLFSICSAFAFLDGPMNWDGSRVAGKYIAYTYSLIVRDIGYHIGRIVFFLRIIMHKKVIDSSLGKI